MQKKSLFITLIALFSLTVSLVRAQAPAGNINQLISKITDYNTAMPAEKVFMQFDKPYYAAGDTIWFKGYLVDEGIKYSTLSSRLYVELLNDSSAVVKRFVFPVSYGITWGYIPLSTAFMHDGSYTIRAYTNWMRNFSADYFFNHPFYVSDPAANTWLAGVQPSLNANNVQLAIKLSDIGGKTSPADLNLKVLNNKKVLLRNTAQTNAEGITNVNFDLPTQDLKYLTLAVQDKADKNRSILLPVRVNRPQDVDIQFMPESGSLVAGLPSKVGFKAVGEDGTGVAITGAVYDNDHNQIAQLNAIHNGMGVFDLSPQADKIYTAEVLLPNGGKRSVPLPVAAKTGSVLSVRNSLDRDTITLIVYNNNPESNGKYYLIGMARGVVCYGASFKFSNNYFSARVPKALFPTGVAHFILLNETQQPLNERVSFIDHHDNLKIAINPNAQSFNPRDSVALNVAVTDDSGKPAVGSFSVAVTDDSQVKPEGAKLDNIVANLLLSSDLKGYIESAGYYLQHDDAAWKALDALLLTQGWVGYDLKKIGVIPKPAYVAETEFTVNGTVTNLFNKPMTNAKVMLLAKGDHAFIKDTLTDKAGKFTFKNFPPFGRSTFVISAVNERGKTVNGGVSVDEKNLTAATANGGVVILPPWNVNPDATVLNYVKEDKTYREALDKMPQYDANGRLLKGVTIRETPIVRNSKNLNGQGQADQVITEDMMVDAGKQTLGDVLQSKVKNFHVSFYKDSGKKTNLAYFIRDKRVRFVFDGIDIDRFYEAITGQPNEHYEFQKQYIDYISAEDVLGVEVVYNRNALYNNQNLETSELLTVDPSGPRGSDYAYLEITTRGGNGPFLRRATGIYIYKPLAFADFKQFYRPRYAVKSTPNGTDLRSTIHWEPNVVTKTSGTATVSFYTADKPTTYTIICEGSDMNGKVGVQTATITVK